MAHWKFEDNLNDEIDSANNGTSIVPVSYDLGIDGQAVSIVDPNGFVMIENEIGRLTSITLSLWIKSPTLEGEQDILTATESTADGTVYLYTMSAELWGRVYGPGGAELGNVTTLLTLDQWDHCVLKYDTEAEEMVLYLNGERIAQSGIMAGINPVLPPLSIGAKNSLENYFDGLIDDVRIYNYPVSDLDIALLYTDFVPGGEACIGNPEFDLNEDCRVTLLDFAILAEDWANCNLVPDCQFSLP